MMEEIQGFSTVYLDRNGGKGLIKDLNTLGTAKEYFIGLR